jgi:hypothetical protein
MICLWETKSDAEILYVEITIEPAPQKITPSRTLIFHGDDYPAKVMIGQPNNAMIVRPKS